MSDPVDREERYDQLMRLADLFDATGTELRARAALGRQVLADPAVAESGELSQRTFEQFEAALRAATTGRLGLQTRSVELDADAFVVRATVLTYRWIDDLQDAAFRTLGSIAGRAVGYLAPQVALGGAIVSAGLIETDALDRDDVASYLNELAESNPALMDHFTSGGGGLLESLQMRSLLTAGALAGDAGTAAARSGLRALGLEGFSTDAGAALRDSAAGLGEASDPGDAEIAVGDQDASGAIAAPRSFADLLGLLADADTSVTLHRLTTGRFIVALPGPHVGLSRLRLVSADAASYADQVVAALETALADIPDPHVLLLGGAQGGLAAAQVAASYAGGGFTIDQVVTAGSPASQVPRIPEPIRVLSFEERTDPIALLGSLVNRGVSNRTTVVFEGGDDPEAGYAAGGRAADVATHAELRETSDRLRALGYFSALG